MLPQLLPRSTDRPFPQPGAPVSHGSQHSHAGTCVCKPLCPGRREDGVGGHTGGPPHLVLSRVSLPKAPYRHSPRGTGPRALLLIRLPSPAQALRRSPEANPPTFLTVCKGRPSPRPMKVPAPLNSATCHAHFHPVITTAGVTEVPTGPRCLPRSCCQNLPLSHWSRLEGEAGHGCRLRAGVDQLQAVCAAPGESWWD